ncbi:DUF262 domain-containing protein [Campylobacter corcagiensis]|uniref:DUF262 domain-containing protein n=1 Tax=Campylobacter corcagiensis TaxID=1448857 RepID=A0A7M1LH45_9BACT|nr:DUF262 domain-containing protein [Campylobacter corcagiensis]QKF65506.1 DUF262 domain-containing protein [Campylobacter corcagiensis]QOQ87922.1 DUF262 domain-containing protein [Campylobacter corcagiensis]
MKTEYKYYNLKEDFEGEEVLEPTLDNYNDIYPLKGIRIDKGRMSIFEFKRKYDDKIKGNIVLNPDFQRDDKRWGDNQKSELIESILMGIPLPVIYFFQDKDGKNQVVDGRQRLTCIAEFLDDKFQLKKLKIIPDVNGKKFSELEPILQNKIEDYQLEIYTILPPTPEKVKFNIFDRLNRGGTKLNNQEMRNALYQGTSTKLIKELSELESFKIATDNSLNPITMKDRYLILRFISFYFLKKNQLCDIEYGSDIDEFLANAMKCINKQNYDFYKEFINQFDKVMTYISKNYGDCVFRFESKDGSDRKRPINMGLFEVITYMFFIAMEKNIKIDIEKLKKLKKYEFDKPERFTYGIDSKDNIKFRFNTIDNFLKGCND